MSTASLSTAGTWNASPRVAIWQPPPLHSWIAPSETLAISSLV